MSAGFRSKSYPARSYGEAKTSWDDPRSSIPRRALEQPFERHLLGTSFRAHREVSLRCAVQSHASILPRGIQYEKTHVESRQATSVQEAVIDRILLNSP